MEEEVMSQTPIESATEEERPSTWEGRGDGGNTHAEHGQGSMFDEPAPTAGLEAYTSPNEEIDAAFSDVSDSLEDFSQLSTETDLETVIEQEATSFEAQEFHESALEGKSEQASVSEPPPSSAEPMGEPSTPDVATPSADVPEAEAAPASEPLTVLTADDFAALEDRILRTVSLIKREREARIAAEGQVAALESQKQALEEQSMHFETQCNALETQLKEHETLSPVLERLEREIDTLRAEREQVRQRVERLLGQLDALEL
jgi:hypothetical protein